MCKMDWSLDRVSISICCFFFVKQKTAYEMRISDWSSDVCSSDLAEGRERIHGPLARRSAAEVAVGDDDPGLAVGLAVEDEVRLLRSVLVEAQEIGRASCRESACQYV